MVGELTFGMLQFIKLRHFTIANDITIIILFTILYNIIINRYYRGRINYCIAAVLTEDAGTPGYVLW